MITKEIARLIYNAHAEIQNSHKMIEDIKANLTDNGKLEIKNEWGDISNNLQLHIPKAGSGSYAVKGVRPEVAIKVLLDHIEDNEKELVRLKDVCKIQLA